MTAKAFTPEQVSKILAGLSTDEKVAMLALMDELDERKRVASAQMDFLAFIAVIDGNYKFGTHLKKLGHLLMDVEQGAQDRIAVSMPPRFGKSQMISIYYPAWYLGRHPDRKVIVASHTVDLAVVMSRKVRNLMRTSEYQAIFPDTQIAIDAKAAGQWNTTAGGEFFACGTGGALAGRGAHLIIADDVLSEQDIKAGNTASLDTVYDWFTAGLRTRLMPGGAICVLHCLVGNTRITMGDGSEKPLTDVRPGDMVASYDRGVIRPAKVLLWANQGLDDVYTIALRSGDTIRGNERHPLLVNQNGAEQWVKIRDLKPGMLLVSTSASQKGVASHHITGRNRGYANPATTLSGCAKRPLDGCTPPLCIRISPALQKVAPDWGNRSSSPVPVKPAGHGSIITRKILMHLDTLLGITDSGKAKCASQKVVESLRIAKGYVLSAVSRLTMRNERLRARTTALKREVTATSRPDMASLGTSTTQCTNPKEGGALYVGRCLTRVTPQTPGSLDHWPLTTATPQEKSGHCCATPATSLSRNETPQSCFVPPLRTLSITLDEIVSITPSGREEVFDIQVEGTENFLANGVVSHNTRWALRDLIGRLLKDSDMNPDGDKYESFEFPAILNENTPEEKSLWPEQWSLESLQTTRASMHHILWQWHAQYQQNPTASEAAIIKREWIKWWPKADPPQIDFLVQSYDTALTTKARSDFSVCQTWGVWHTEDGVSNVILLNCIKGKYEFPELKVMAHEQFAEWEPDSVIVEAKASGQPLIDEMRRSGIFVQDFSPGKGQDKIARLNACADMFASGHVWFPETAWAADVVEELLAFPAGEHDDQTDALTLALHRVRKGGLLRLSSDSQDMEDTEFTPRKGYYG